MTNATTPAPVVITTLDESHAEFAAVLHAAELPHGFFARLGTAFLQGYYRAFSRSPHAIGLLAAVGHRPAGVLVGTVAHRANYRWMIQDEGAHLALAALGGLLRRPWVGWRFLRTRARRYLRGVLRLRRDQGRGAGGVAAVLTHVAVAPDARGYGVGTVLVEAFLSEAARAGAPRARLSTLAGEEGAGGFYRQLGWDKVAGTTDYDGRAIEVYATSTDPRRR